MKRVSFLIDGFNLYHSVCEASIACRVHTKWLNINALCKSFLPLIGNTATLQSVYYFTSFAEFLGDPRVIIRHQNYIECLKSTGVIISKGRFKPKQILCPLCRREFTRYEEKETDVAVAVKLLDVFICDECDTCVLMTGDTDLIPAVITAQGLFPSKTVLFAFPYNRKNQELVQIAPGSFRIKGERYSQFQFDNPVVLPSGKTIAKPEAW